MSESTFIKSAEHTGPLLPEGALPQLLGMPRQELQQSLTGAGLESFRAKQVWQWVYQKGARAFADMSSLGKAQREKLEGLLNLARPAVVTEQRSNDGTIKWLLGFADGNKAEMVFIPDEERGTLCVSSQVGCTLTCTFCHTGTQKLVRNLTAAEIVGQFMLARDALGDWERPEGERRLTNIVMMGMGEPLFNYDEVAKALHILMDADGVGWSKRRITLSTSGVVPMITRCGEELGVNLAVSLHAVTNELRNQIVPLNRKYPIEQLLEACRHYPGTHQQRRITFEYVMLAGVNDSDADAHTLASLIRDIPAKVNLIPFNAWPGAPYQCSSNNRIRAFSELLRKRGVDAPVRTPRGRDILAACGQLKSDSERKRKSERLNPNPA